ncbi:CHAT domain-containing protein [Novosphingobium subterraneum]|uniref:TPR repeat-containing protein n=1 Tax=Novosphingobium subterraneum TaxID=48936 RepID=A0A0B8ZQK9_9SPHN|nr:CHAT domain-containing protein [Novosphingobium subterraneum]KHS48479.1 TPR repeat-containing protein [Novosphingobium subterraneum]
MNARIKTIRSSAMMAALLASAATPLQAAEGQQPLSIRNSFRVGSSGVTCTAQNAPLDKRLGGIFDRGYRVSCRDAAGAVGSLIAVRRDISMGNEPTGLPGVTLACGGEGSVAIETLGRVSAVNCRDQNANVEYKRYAVKRGGTTYFVEGLAGYDPALRLALASVVSDSPVPGEIRVATTEVSDPAAFARVQAGQLDRLGARDEGYLRNNGGRFAESSEFFEALASRDRSTGGAGLAEALANQGLQQSNLGNFTAADRLLSQAAGALSRGDGVTQRLIRNYRAINRLNQRKAAAALKELATPVSAVGDVYDRPSLAAGVINAPLAEQINRESSSLKRLGAVDPGLTDLERAEILDAQADALKATAARVQGRLDEAVSGFEGASRRLEAVRGGRVASAGWLRAEIQIELALLAEAQGRKADSGAAFDRAIALIGASFPQSPALLATQARKAAWLGRSGDEAGALALYGKVVEESLSVPDAGTTLRDLLGPYFGLLAKSNGPDAAKATFVASQVLQRPGVAQTQAVLARQMSEGNDEAAALFRLSLVRTRDIARTEALVEQLSAVAMPDEKQRAALVAAQDNLASLRRDQTALVSKLAAFPRYNVLAPRGVELAELQAALKPGESYYKLMLVGDRAYGLFATSGDARVVDLGLTPAALARQVQDIRDTIVKVENGQQVNYPFDLDKSRALYKAVFGQVEDLLPGTRHLIFEPDGAMLQLPPTVLVAGDKGIAEYKKRMESPDGDPFDFTGVEWLGRGREVSIAVSPRGFLDIRKLAASGAPRNYLGLGHNAKPTQRPMAAVADECDWPLATWQNPISADELLFAQKKLSLGGSAVKTDAQFSDSALLSESDLDQYRVLHFATHGLVTAPRADCPARPALVTSFGDMGSDGLLSFREIFDLKLNADLVILSACDTAGMATVAASREAGVTTGGNYALDGLVRAFVGAGARSVIASHWPVPDDFDATKRLIGGVIDSRPGQELASALEGAQEKLMDDPNTSHPFYWAAFIIVGDGAKPLVTGNAPMTTQASR